MYGVVIQARLLCRGYPMRNNLLQRIPGSSHNYRVEHEGQVLNDAVRY